MRTLLVQAIILFIGTDVFARVGDTPKQLKERFGEPTSVAFDQEGYGVGVYRAAGFNEIRITFVEGKSQFERYLPADEKTAREPIVAALKKENPGERVNDNSSLGIGVGDKEISELKFVTHSGLQTSYTGIIEVKKSDKQRYAVLRTPDAVIEIPAAESEIEFKGLRTGLKCDVTLLDENFEDINTALAVVGRRAHVDWDDAVDDAHDHFQLLVKIVSGDEVLFDRAVCGVHHTQMELRSVAIGYGMHAFSANEIFCEGHYPHARDYALGGCMVGDAKVASIYVCSACVVACNEYKQAHPANDRN